VKLHVFQDWVCDEFFASLGEHRRIVVACPTGSGKTVIAMHGILRYLPAPVLWVTHRRELLKQAERHKMPVNVQMVGSFSGGDFKSVIIDEGHHCSAAQYQQIFRALPKAIVVALTATPYRLDGVGLGSCGFTKIINGPDTLELTKLRVLCPAVTFVPGSESTSSWVAHDCAKLIAARRFKKAIVYCRTVEDAVKTSSELIRIGVRSSVIHGETKEQHREDIEESFRNGKTKVLCNHTIFTEGYDLPEVDMIVLNRHTQSRCLWKQMTGRGLRRSHGKTRFIILDLAGNGVTHGSIYDREIYGLDGSVEKVEQRELPESSERDESEYEYNAAEKLKLWKPQPRPISIIESLHRLKSRSPLLKLMTALYVSPKLKRSL